MKYGARSFPSGTAVIDTGGKQASVWIAPKAHESSPCANPFKKFWFAAAVASMALLGAPGAIAVPPAVPSSPP